jgi:lipopolysaccharide/colanic/teichoic acid biosynthesis glycosyltransferase
MWKGDLSLVGPRPERPELLEQFVKEIPQFNLRMNLRPGLTGLAQLKGRYATKPKDKLRYDVIYMKNMSPFLDCILLVISVLVTLKAGWQSGRDGKR